MRPATPGLCLIAGLLLAACGDTTGQRVATGAVGGAVAGQVIAEEPAGGALIGAGLGAIRRP